LHIQEHHHTNMPSTKIVQPKTLTIVKPIHDDFLNKPNTTNPEVTLRETFLDGKFYKILKPVDGIACPNAREMLQRSPKKRVVVGVSGVSCGGKTTVASALFNWLGGTSADGQGTLLMQDDYYLPFDELPLNTFTNFKEFDEPESVKMHEIRDTILKWLEQPEPEETQVLIVEGTMIFTDKTICELCDLRYLVHVDFEVARERRSQRNYPVPDPPLIMEKNIWPKYIKHRNIFCGLRTENQFGEAARFKAKQINGTKNVMHTVAGILQDVKVNKHE